MKWGSTVYGIRLKDEWMVTGWAMGKVGLKLCFINFLFVEPSGKSRDAMLAEYKKMRGRKMG